MGDDGAVAPKNNISDSNDVRPSLLCCRDFDVFARSHGEIESTNGKLGNHSLCFCVL